MKISGNIVAVVTPMQADGAIDENCLGDFLDELIEQGANGVVIAGTTGESPTLSMHEHRQLIAFAIKSVGGRIPVIAGVGANATAESVELTKNAQADGADAGLSVVPYYNKPPQEGLYRHFSTIADSCSLPMLLYDVPGRCITTFETDTLVRLAEHENIIGIKDATGDIPLGVTRMRHLPDDFIFLSGDDKTAKAYIQAGGAGVISVTGNLVPAKMSAMIKAARDKDNEKADALDADMADFHLAQSVQANPIPLKWVLADTGKIPAGIRLPLTPLAETRHAIVRDAAQKALKDFL